MSIFFLSMIIIVCYMTALFLIALQKKDNSIVDIGWGVGFIILALFSLFRSNLFLLRHLLVTTLVLIWGIRLSYRIYLRNRGKGEDKRYAQWRAEWGKNLFWRSFLQIFMLQGAILLIIAWPVIHINSTTSQVSSIFDYLGLFVWLIGFYWEAVGDYQLDKFLANPSNKGKILQSGLWHYSRHPNYFGEATMWWGVWLIACGTNFGFITVISPILLTFLLLFVSGVPMTEKLLEGNPEFKEYKRRTSAFIPWFPKK